MIRKLSDNDKSILLDFLMEESTFNLFIIGDILNTDFKENFMDVWGEFDERYNLIAVLLRYFNNFIPYYKKSYNGGLNDLKKIISTYNNKKLISGKYDIVKRFTDVLKNFEEKKKYFCELKNRTLLLKENENILIKNATVNDAERLSDFIDTIKEFLNTGEDRDMLKNTIKSGSGRYYYIENEIGNIISVAGTSAENKYAAMVVSVATDPKYRKKGLAVNCVSKLCKDTIKDCEKICLFYDNKEAGKIYHGIGFETIGNWLMAVEK